ncbi:MAG: hypothetical protein ACLFR1_11965 [Spirochaetia bacterium]
MDKVDLTARFNKKKIPAGTFLTVQGEQTKALMLLHSGLAEVLSCSDQSVPSDLKELGENSYRVGLIKGESICGILDMRGSGPYNHSIRTISECVVSSMPMEPRKLVSYLQSKFSMNLQVLRALIQRTESAVFLIQNYKYLWHKLASIQDSLALASFFPAADKPDPQKNRYNTTLKEYAGILKNLINKKQLPMPLHWDHNLFLGRVQDSLNLYNDNEHINVENLMNNPQVLFFKRLLRKKDVLLTGLLQNDEPSTFYIFQVLSKNLLTLLQKNEEMVKSINKMIETLFKQGGWITETLQQQDSMDNQMRSFNYYLNVFTNRIVIDVKMLLGSDLRSRYPLFNILKKFEKTNGAKTDHTPETDIGQGLQKYKNLLQRILDFAEMPEEFCSRFTNNLSKFKNAKEKFELNTQLNALKQKLSSDFWKLYEKCFLKVIASDLKAFIPGVMLHFGLLDETMVTDEQLEIIDNLYSQNLLIEGAVPVMTLPYFLDKIYKAEINPSMSELGESFKALLKRQQKFSKKELESSVIYEDTPEDKIRYEIHNIAINTSKLLFGSKKKAVPFLCNEAILGNPERMRMDPDKTADMVNEIRQRDFSVFYRETVCHHAFGSDIIDKEVSPNFVIYPGQGSRMMMWQELDGTKRDTRGRIYLPLFFIGKQKETLTTMIAHFRWELQKIIAGVKYMDPVEGGFVGAYYDYINFYKKNSKLSTEIKEKIGEFIKKTRSDRERFAIDYCNWVLHEYEGRIKMNNVTRDIFYRYCPFPEEIREEMAKKPLYANLQTKYKNRVRKLVLKMESRKKKFEKSNEPMPEDLRKYIEYLEY